MIILSGGVGGKFEVRLSFSISWILYVSIVYVMNNVNTIKLRLLLSNWNIWKIRCTWRYTIQRWIKREISVEQCQNVDRCMPCMLTLRSGEGRETGGGVLASYRQRPVDHLQGGPDCLTDQVWSSRRFVPCSEQGRGCRLAHTEMSLPSHANRGLSRPTLLPPPMIQRDKRPYHVCHHYTIIIVNIEKGISVPGYIPVSTYLSSEHMYRYIPITWAVEIHSLHTVWNARYTYVNTCRVTAYGTNPRFITQ